MHPQLTCLRFDEYDPLDGTLGPRARHWTDHKISQRDMSGHSDKFDRDLFHQMLLEQVDIVIYFSLLYLL